MIRQITKYTAEIFEILSKGNFISANSSDPLIQKLYAIIDEEENFEALHDYFGGIKFQLERGDDYFYFSRNVPKATLEKKLEAAYKWIDIVDFFKTFDSAFGVGFRFTSADINVKLKTDTDLKNKLDSLQKTFGRKNQAGETKKTSYSDVINRLVDQLRSQNFVELQDEVLKNYKVLTSFRYLEELILRIDIAEEIEDEIPE